VNLLLGVLDPDTYLNGEMFLDAERSKAVITKTIAEPLGISLEEALVRMEDTLLREVGRSLRPIRPEPETTTVAAFGGGGPMSACSAARIAGVRHVLVPKLGRLFSAFGISFSDNRPDLRDNITGLDCHRRRRGEEGMEAKASRDMFQEGHELSDARWDWTLVTENEDGSSGLPTVYSGGSLPSPTAGPERHPVPHGDVRVAPSRDRGRDPREQERCRRLGHQGGPFLGNPGRHRLGLPARGSAAWCHGIGTGHRRGSLLHGESPGRLDPEHLGGRRPADSSTDAKRLRTDVPDISAKGRAPCAFP